VVVPAVIPVTTPVDAPMVPIDVLLLVHVPPVVGLVSVMLPDWHTMLPLVGPTIAGADEATVTSVAVEQPDGIA
jgi:hypothetical protein